MINTTKLILIWVIGFGLCFIIPPLLCHVFAVKTIMAVVIGMFTGLFIATVCINLSNKVLKI